MSLAGVARTGRLLLAGMLVLGSAGIATATPADAHAIGHSCGKVASSGYSCRLTFPNSTVEGIESHYNGTLRGAGLVGDGGVMVCDNNGGDTIDPHLRVQYTNGVYEEFDSSGPGNCTPGDLDRGVRRYRLLNRGPNGGPVTHGTNWYS
jgi:hypothetical protein